VQDGLEVVALAGVFRVEELDELEAKRLVRKLLGDLGVHLGAHDEPEKKLVHYLRTTRKRDGRVRDIFGCAVVASRADN
jgi:hypothetical protein